MDVGAIFAVERGFKVKAPRMMKADFPDAAQARFRVKGHGGVITPHGFFHSQLFVYNGFVGKIREFMVPAVRVIHHGGLLSFCAFSFPQKGRLVKSRAQKYLFGGYIVKIPLFQMKKRDLWRGKAGCRFYSPVVKRLYGVFFFQCDLRPSICSKRLSFISAHMGSKIKSMPSRRASLAAGTKSLSPAIKII